MEAFVPSAATTVGKRRGVSCACDAGGGWIRRAAPMQGKSVYADSVQWSVPEMAEDPVNLLEELIWWKNDEVDMRKERLPFLALRNRVMALSKGDEADVARGPELLEQLRRAEGDGLRTIAEIRSRWPGDEEANGTVPDAMRSASKAEAAGAVAVAVQTDEKYFGGSLQDMNRIKAACALPIICTEALNQPYQFYDMRYHRADACVALAAVFSRKDMDYNLRIAGVLNMALFVEVHTPEELEYAMSFEELRAVLICSRDFATLRASTSNVAEMVQGASPALRERGIVVVAEGPPGEAEGVDAHVDAFIQYRA